METDEKKDVSNDIVTTTTTTSALSMSGALDTSKGYNIKMTNTAGTLIQPAMIMDDPLIVMLPIAEYDKAYFRNLDGVPRDVDNFVNTFPNYWGYKIFYKLNDNTSVYSNKRDELKTNYKLRWDKEEIELFVEEARKYIVKNKHNGLVFAISAHGEREGMLYDSEYKKCELDSIFTMFTPEFRVFVESYQESEDESFHLFHIPKLFFCDMCRGDSRTHVKKVAFSNDEIQSSPFPWIKAQLHELVAQVANFSHVYANTEGFAVGGWSEQGSHFLRSVFALFRNTKFIRKHKWTDIIFKIREYTKRNATIATNLDNFTQVVENEGTLERPVVFGSKYIISQSDLPEFTEKATKDIKGMIFAFNIIKALCFLWNSLSNKYQEMFLFTLRNFSLK